MESRVELTPRFRSLLEAIARRVKLTEGRCELTVHLEDGRVRDVVVTSRVSGSGLEQLVPDVDIDELLGEIS